MNDINAQALPKRRRKRPEFLKQWYRAPLATRLICALLAFYVRLVHRTTRWTIVNEGVPRAYWDAGKPFIVAFWHNRILMMPCFWQSKQTLTMMATRHADGDITSGMMGHFRFNTVRGSAGDEAKGGSKRDKGGASALRALARIAHQGGSVGVTPDGPRGPRMRAGIGTAALARISGLPVIVAAPAVNHRRVFNSWDRFILPFPFSRGAFVIGDPIEVSRGADDVALETARKTIEDELNRVTAEADAIAGVPRIEPAPMRAPALAEAGAP